ncbi:phasin family protein [Luteimonas kalidii]|uniref:Phasin family protein n=1 Tax=Luteimonas kalidii TaxID=3042025 RepID=A0ABT6JRI9_9GAMM|nr:phasin family protein [Luteimonas kalidii]MDH5833299.1 phasin family protein [Luteimonas kalidii]
MGNASDLPMQLWKANLDLQLRLGRLLQDSGREWMELGTRAAGEGAAELDAEFRKLLGGGDWQGLATLPAEAFWRQAEQRVGDSQAIHQLALHAQEGFVRGVVEALQDWQGRLTDAWSGAGMAAGSTPDLAQAWQGLVSDWEAGLANLAPSPRRASGTRGAQAGPTVATPAAKQSAAAKPAAKKSAAKKSAAKKSAAKKPAAKKSASGPSATRKPAAKKTAARKSAPAKKGARRRNG